MVENYKKNSSSFNFSISLIYSNIEMVKDYIESILCNLVSKFLKIFKHLVLENTCSKFSELLTDV